MEPVSMIVTAVVAGAASGVTDAVKDEVKAVYSALRARLLERFRDSSLVKKYLADTEREPTDENQEFLTESLSGKGISDDDELVRLAKRVIAVSELSIEQIQEIAKNANVRGSGVSIEGLSQDAPARIYQRQSIGEEAKVEDSPTSIKFRESSGR